MNQSTFAKWLHELPFWLHLTLATVAGSLIVFSFAPFHYWPLSIISLTALALLNSQQSLKHLLWRSWFFGIGMYGAGISWIYVSISGFGGAPAPLAVLLVAVFVMFMTTLFCIPFYVFGRWFNRNSLSLLIGFPAIWLLGEWTRTWLLTGFPWLFIGYADLTNWLSGWAPITGVMGLSLISAMTAAWLAQIIAQQKQTRTIFIYTLIIFSLWIAGFNLKDVQWTTPSTTPTSIAIVQPNINQDRKWQIEFRNATLDFLSSATEPLWGTQIIIWPESAVTEIYSDALPFLNTINRKAADSNSGILTGIIYDDQHKGAYFNSIVALGTGMGIYHKRRLVPFGEYVPMNWLRNLIEFFNLPTSYISIGPDDQHPLKINDLVIAPSVCYEVAYPDLIAKNAAGTQLLMSVSNLGWFGDSLGRHQFMEMAQMRALETQHYYAYSTNNGPSAVFNRKGEITAKTQAFEQTTLKSEVFAVEGETPFMRFGSLPLVVLSFLALLLMMFVREKGGNNQS